MKIRLITFIIAIIFLTTSIFADPEQDYNSALKYYDSGQYEEAAKLFLKSARDGLVASQEYIAYMYDYGYGVKQDYEQAIYWYKKAIDQGSTYAMGNLGYLYYSGRGVKQDYKKAFELFNESNESHFSQYYIGLIYYYGYGIKQDYNLAFDWFLKSSENGYKFAEEMLAYMYENGHGTEQNYDKAIYWYNKAIDQGSTYAMGNLGYLYYNGKGVTKDYNKAFELFSKSSDDYFSQYYLGLMYLNGYGVTIDYKKSFEWFDKSSKNDYMNAMEYMGYMYKLGYGVEKDYKIAMEWFEKAVKKNSNYAYYMIGILYYDGNGVEKNKKKAYDYFIKASDMGNTYALEYLGYMYEFGEGVSKDLKKAVEWYTKGAEKESDYCQYRLGLMYMDGKGTEKNLDIAYKWFRKASDQGNKDATETINDMLDSGYKVSSTNKNSTTDKDAPIIYIDKNNFSRVTDSKITINGRAYDESGVAIVSINEKEAILREDGTFSVAVLLKIGENNINVSALDIYENESQESFKIIRYTKEETEEIDTSKVTLGNWYLNQYAIIIGIDVYENTEIPALKNAENDASSISDILKKSNYKVTALIGSSATRKNILTAIKDIRSKITANDSFLFYFAGHGQALTTGHEKKVGYIIPYDASVNLSSGELMDFEEQAISLDQLKKYINDIPAKHIAIILDSCFSGLAMESRGELRPVKRSDTKEYYETLLKNKSINLLTAGDDQPVSDGSDHSPFTRAILMALQKGNIDIEDNDGFATFSELSVYVKKKVEKMTEGRQRPQFENLTEDDGDYIFKISRIK